MNSIPPPETRKVSKPSLRRIQEPVRPVADRPFRCTAALLGMWLVIHFCAVSANSSVVIPACVTVMISSTPLPPDTITLPYRPVNEEANGCFVAHSGCCAPWPLSDRWRKGLKRQRLLGTESPVIVEYGNALWQATKSAELSFHSCNEIADRSFCSSFVHDSSGSTSPARLAGLPPAWRHRHRTYPMTVGEADVNTTASKSQGIGRHIYNPAKLSARGSFSLRFEFGRDEPG